MFAIFSILKNRFSKNYLKGREKVNGWDCFGCIIEAFGANL